MNQLYQTMTRTVWEEGASVVARGRATRELLHVVSVLDRPQARVLTQPGRGANPFFQLAESIWMLGGRADAEWILYYNSRLAEFLDPGSVFFHAPYGERIRRAGDSSRLGELSEENVAGQNDQLRYCYETLQKDPRSRRAVMTVWLPALDSWMESRDLPCNVAMFFKMRPDDDGHECLDMTVANRSNDLHLGLTSTNIVQWTTVQEMLASWLGVGVGTYCHWSDSLHVYEDSPITAAVLAAPGFDVYDYVAPLPFPSASPEQTDAWVQALLRLGTAYRERPVADLLRASAEADPGRTYWDGSGHALLAYSLHKHHVAPACVARAVGKMPMWDWLVECLRFLADRYGPEPGFVEEVNGILRRGALLENGRESPVRAYIFHGSGVKGGV